MSVQVSTNGAGLDRNVIMAGGCAARVFIDGIHLQQSALVGIDDLLSPDRIAGIEMYPRGVTAPAQYQGAANCGVVLFWTKEPQLGAPGGWSVKRVVVGLGLLAGLLTVGLLGS